LRHRVVPQKDQGQLRQLKFVVLEQIKGR